MLDPLLTLIAAKAKAVGLVAGTALVTTALVGGGAVAITAVSSETPLTEEAVVSAAATPTVGIGNGKGQGAENRSATATAVLEGKAPAASVVFTCDPTKNHGQNVSAYAKSLPKGPGRGQQVSAAAKSDCGKKAGEAKPAKPVKAAKPAKPAKAPKPVKPAKAAKPAKPAKAATAAVPAERAKPAKPAKGKGSGKG